jgi:hypothetical protein
MTREGLLRGPLAVSSSANAAGADPMVAAEPAPATADRLVEGVWTATVDMGQGAEPATATFTAAR